MKILYIGSDSLMCGAGLSMIKLIEEEQNKGIDVIPVVRNGFSEKILEEKKIKHYVVNAQSWIVSKKYNHIKRLFTSLIKKGLNIKCYFQYKKIIKTEDPDIVHINSLTTYVGAKAAIDLKKKVVWHIRELIDEDLNAEFVNINKAKKIMKKAYAFIAISDCVEKKYSNIIQQKKIYKIYNGIDKDDFYCHNHCILNNDNIIITMAGRITKEKGQAMCLKSLANLLNSNEKIILQFAGTGSKEELKSLNNIIEEEKINKNQVAFLGYVKNMKKVWEDTDIAIVYSKFEAFGRVTIEAKMAGSLVVGFNSGGTSELIEDKIDGFLFNNSSELLDKVAYIVNNKTISQKIALTGQKQACEKFTSKINCEKIIKLFNDIIEEKI